MLVGGLCWPMPSRRRPDALLERIDCAQSNARLSPVAASPTLNLRDPLPALCLLKLDTKRIRQVRPGFYANSRNAFNNRVLRLVRNKYLVRDEIPYRTQGYVYSISDKGASELIGLGEYYTSPTCRPKDGQIPKAVFHAIELNEIHLALKRSQQLVR